MPADGTKSFDEFRTSEEGKEPASTELERSLDPSNLDDTQGRGETPPGGASTGNEPASPDPGTHEASTSTKGESDDGEQEDSKDSTRSKEDQERQLRALSVEEGKLDEDIISKKQRISEKRAARRAMLEAAKDEGLFQRDTRQPAQSSVTDDDPDRPLTRKEVDDLMFTRDSNFQLQSFLEQHSEYTPEKDMYNERWDKLQVAIRKYKEPRDPASMRQVLEWAHTDVTRSSTTMPPPSPSRASQDATRTAQLAVAGHGASGSGKGAGAGSSQAVDQTKVDMLMRGGFPKDQAIRIVQKASRR